MGQSSLSDPSMSLDLEPNPFEQSFRERESSGTSDIGSDDVSASSLQKNNSNQDFNNISNNHAHSSESKTVSSSGTIPDFQSMSTAGSSAPSTVFSSNNNNQSLTPESRRVLPPMSSISSPSALPSDGNNANTGWSDSLRSGPLSPAMLQGPVPHNTQHPSTTATNGGSAPATISKTSTAANTTTVANGIRPSPLSPFIQGSLLGSDSGALFHTPGPATAAILNSLNNELIGSTGLTPLPLKAGIAPGVSTAVTASSLAPAAGSLSQVSQGIQVSPLQSTSTAVASAPESTTAASQASVLASNGHSGSVDAAASLYMMSKSGSQPYQQQPSSNTLNSAVRTGVKRGPICHSSVSSQDMNSSISSLLSSSNRLSSDSTGLSSNSVMLPNSSPIVATAAVPNSTRESGPPSKAFTTTKRGRGGSKSKLRKGNPDEDIPTEPGSRSNSDGSNSSRPRRQKSESGRSSKVKKESSIDCDNHEEEGNENDRVSASISDESGSSSFNSSKDTSHNARNEKKCLHVEEKRKSFLERNRIAALKCRQRKKQWVQELQAKLESYSSQNSLLNRQIVSLQDEVLALRNTLLNHRSCSQGLDPKLLSSLLAGQAAAAPSGLSQVSGISVAQPRVGNSMVQAALSQQGQPNVGQHLHPIPSQQVAAASSIGGPVMAPLAAQAHQNASHTAAGMIPHPQQLQQAPYGYQQSLYSGTTAAVPPNSHQHPQGNLSALLQASGAAR